jgi:thymidine kinase
MMKSKLSFIFSSMNSGKSLSLLTRNFMLREKGAKTILMKPEIDDRTPEISSRIGVSEKCVLIPKDSLPSDCLFKNHGVDAMFADYIFVDEAQFLSKEQVWDLADIVDKYDVNVMCYGIKLNWLGNFFTGSEELMKIADELVQMETYCKRNNGATAMFHIKNGGSDNPVETGYEDLYETVSRKVWKQWWENKEKYCSNGHMKDSKKEQQQTE